MHENEQLSKLKSGMLILFASGDFPASRPLRYDLGMEERLTLCTQ